MSRPWIYHDDDLELRGELYEPTAAPDGRAVLVVHEADGIGGNVRRRCEMLAALGYVAGAADMHGGGRVLNSDEIPAALDRFRSDAGLLRGRVGAAFESMKGEIGLPSSHVAAMGYCFGGYTVLELARSGVAAQAIASFHGILTTPARASAGDIRAPVLIATGLKDPLVPDGDVAAFETEMNNAGADWHLLKHARAFHSFTNAEHGRKVFLPPRRKLGEVERRPHMQAIGSPNTLRHTIHTWHQRQGVPQAQIDAAAGHSSEQGSGANYTHLRPEYLREFLDSTEAFWRAVDSFTSVHRCGAVER